MEIPRLIGMFRPAPIVDNPQGNENFINNIQALKNPSGTLNDLQTEQVIKSMAGLKADGLMGKYQEHAINAINAFQDKATKRYMDNKGFNRLSLTPQQLLEQERDYRNLLMDINAGKELTKDYANTYAKAGEDIAKGSLLPEDYTAFHNEMEKMNSESKSINDMPLAHVVYDKYLQHSTKALDANRATKDQMERVKLTDAVLSQINNGMDQQKSWDIDKATRNVDKLPPAIVDQLGGKDKVIEWARDTWIKQKEPKYTTNVNNWGVKNEKSVPYVNNPDGTKSWPLEDISIDISKGPVKGYIVGVTKGTDGKFYGDLSVKKLTDQEEKEFFSVGGKKTVDQSNNTIYQFPLDANDFGKIKRKGIALEEGDQEGFDISSMSRMRTSKENNSATEVPAKPNAYNRITKKEQPVEYIVKNPVNGKSETMTKQDIINKLQELNPGQVITESDVQRALKNVNGKLK